MLTWFRCLDGVIERRTAFDEALYAASPPTALHWVDLEDPSEAEGALLESVFHFHPLAVEDALAVVHHPKVDDYDDYILVIVHGIRFDAPNDAFVTRELDVFLGRNLLVTHHEGGMRSVAAVRDECTKGLNAALPKGVDFLLHDILDQMFEHYFPNLDALEDKLQSLQLEVFERPSRETLERIFAVKRDVFQLRRLCLPQREIVHRLSRAEFRVISARAAVYFRDIYDNLYRLVDSSLAYQDQVQGTLDAYLSAVNNRLNETMKRIAVVGAVFAALTVITGIYGMNFEHMPELRWRLGYPTVLAVMLATVAGLLWIFKRKDWL